MLLKMWAGACILYVEVTGALFCEGVRIQEQRVLPGEQITVSENPLHGQMLPISPHLVRFFSSKHEFASTVPVLSAPSLC